VPQGLQIWDATSNLILDTTSRIPKLLGSTTVSTNGNLNNSDFSTGTPYALVLPITEGVGEIHTLPEVTFSGNTMTWTYVGGMTNLQVLIIYGIS
jgi:hypothetical protein